MTFNEYSSYIGTTASIATLLNVFVSKQRNDELFRLVFPSTANAVRVHETIGEASARFLDNTIFFMFRGKPFSFRSLAISSLLSIVVLFFAVALPYFTRSDAREYHEVLGISVATLTDAISQFYNPWRLTSISAAVWTFLALVILLVTDYVSFLQTYLLLRLARSTSSVMQIIFVGWVDFSITFFAALFIIPAVIVVLALRILLCDTTIVSTFGPFEVSADPTVNSTFMESLSGVLTAGTGAEIPHDVRISAMRVLPAVITSTEDLSDREISALIENLQRPAYGGLLLSPLEVAMLSSRHIDFYLMATSMMMGRLVCRSTPERLTANGHSFSLLSSAGSVAIFFQSGGKSYDDLLETPESLQQFTDLLQASGNARTFIHDRSVVLVERVSPISYLTLERMRKLVVALYTLGFERMQAFQARLPSLNLEADPIAQGTYCDLRELNQGIGFGDVQPFGGSITSPYADDLSVFSLFSLFSFLDNQNRRKLTEKQLIGYCRDGYSLWGGDSYVEDPKKIFEWIHNACSGRFYLSANATSPGFSPLERLRAADFSALRSTFVLLPPLIAGSVGVTILFYAMFGCFLFMRIIFGTLSRIYPRVLQAINYQQFVNNFLVAIIFVPCFIVITAFFLVTLIPQ